MTFLNFGKQLTLTLFVKKKTRQITIFEAEIITQDEFSFIAGSPDS